MIKINHDLTKQNNFIGLVAALGTHCSSLNMLFKVN